MHNKIHELLVFFEFFFFYPFVLSGRNDKQEWLTDLLSNIERIERESQMNGNKTHFGRTHARTHTNDQAQKLTLAPFFKPGKRTLLMGPFLRQN